MKIWISRMALLVLLFSTAIAWAGQSSWPRTITLEEGSLTMYEPQIDQWSGDTLHFRAALAWREKIGAEPVFGVGWFESDVTVDRSSGTVHVLRMSVDETRFPDGAPDLQPSISQALSQSAGAGMFSLALDEVEASLNRTRAERQAAAGLNTAPPLIIYRDHPALLVTIDGEPVLRRIENSSLQAVINTPFPLIHDGRHYYLNVSTNAWYRANQATGPYVFDPHPPREVAAMVQADEPATDSESVQETTAEVFTANNAPEIVVSTQPAELIVTDGPAAFVPLVDGLLVLTNSDDDVFMHLDDQAYYIVLAGRWYRSSSLDGPWEFQPSDRLPQAFADIPPSSEQADSRVYVAGTPESQDAVRDSQIPQAAAVKRGEAEVEVEYDGRPEFEPVDGTDLVYATNTGASVILDGGYYYLVEDGVWYVSNSPDGPWQVATRRPAQVVSILPTSPVYNVKYVYIYDSTPDVVYVGYTPGYAGSYVYGSTVFYGSGWYYRPWVSPYYYYPRPATWGFHVSYNSWYGWNFGLSWGWGPVSFDYWTGGYWHYNRPWYNRYYGYWGPCGYRPRHYRPRHHGYPRYAYGNRGHRPAPYQRHDNLYRDQRQQARVVDTWDRRGSKRPAAAGKSRQAGFTSSQDKQRYAHSLRSGSGDAVSRSDVRAKATPVRRGDLVAKSSKQADFRKTAGRRDALGPNRKLAADAPARAVSRFDRKPVPQKQTGAASPQARNSMDPGELKRVIGNGRAPVTKTAQTAPSRTPQAVNRKASPQKSRSPVYARASKPSDNRDLKRTRGTAPAAPAKASRSAPVDLQAARPSRPATRAVPAKPTRPDNVRSKARPSAAQAPKQSSRALMDKGRSFTKAADRRKRN